MAKFLLLFLCSLTGTLAFAQPPKGKKPAVSTQKIMQKTTTFLKFTGEQSGKAKEAVELYTSLFPNSAIQHIELFKEGEPAGTPGQAKQILFTLAGQQYRAMDGGTAHNFTFTPSVSIFVACDSEAEINRLFSVLSEGGEVMMPPDNYGFSKKFTWITDKYGMSWQLNWE